MIRALEIAVQDIRKAIEARAFYAALITTLALPDICPALESEDNRSSREKYKAWYRNWVQDRFYGTFSDDACYALRCGMVHQGQISVPGIAEVTRVEFRLPQETSISAHGCIEDTMVQFELQIFCEEFLAGVERWWEAKGEDPLVKQNIPHMLSYHENGKVHGIPVGAVFA